MALRRNLIDSIHPNALTAEQRRAELSALLACGIMRFRETRQVISQGEAEKSEDFEGNCLEVMAKPCPDGHRG